MAEKESGPDPKRDKDPGAKFCRIKADVVHRLLAKFVDLILVAIGASIFSLVGLVAGVTYLLISDGFFAGQSLGKRLIGLRVVITMTDGNPKATTWKKSMVRNLPVTVGAFLMMFSSFLGFLGFLFFIAGAVILLFETYFVISDDRGLRLGDVFANTQVLDL